MTPLQVVHKQRELAAALLIAAGLAWWWTVNRMAGMDAGPGTDLGTLGWFTGSWAVMMAAMMLPSFAPTLATYVSAAGGGGPSRWLPFTVGYLLIWAAVGLAAYGVFELGKALLAGGLAWHRGGRWLSAGMIAAAAAYELVPLKRACLSRCRGQLGDPSALSRRGWPAALAMGARSGGWCIGCSWALMVALFALGVMSLTWMALVAALVAFEKLGPWPRAASVVTAVVLVALTAGIVISPHEVPGLVVPGSHAAMHAMKTMG
jgi:predicted metal-binding membrane protein